MIAGVDNISFYLTMRKNGIDAVENFIGSYYWWNKSTGKGGQNPVEPPISKSLL